jgi:uncharacterized protein YndB with AHSA1/START domain
LITTFQQQKKLNMETQNKTLITIETLVDAPIEKVWQYWSVPRHITKWSTASADWHTPTAENDFRIGGTFTSRMEAKDGSMGFDFFGVYDDVREHDFIGYTLGDGRKVTILFEPLEDKTKITQAFEAEAMNPVEMQRDGWQSILNNFKKYTEEN